MFVLRRSRSGGFAGSRRAVLALVVLGTLAIPAIPVSAEEPAADVVYSPAFLDVDLRDPFVAEIRALVAASVTHGCDDVGRFFCPDDRVTRGQMAAFLSRSLELPVVSPATFADTASTPFEADIEAIASADVTKGCNPPANTLFCPGDLVNRAQMATFLVRALQLPPASGSFADVPSSSVHSDDISALASAGITKGCNPPANTFFCPDDFVTRAQMAAFLVRAAKLPAVPVLPSGVSVERSTSDSPLTSTVRVCGATGALLVRNAVWGGLPVEDSDGLEVEVLISSGTYDVASDNWKLSPGGACHDLISHWEVVELVFVVPVSDYVVTSVFGYRAHPVLGGSRFHSGVDFGVPAGSSVMAAAGGTVTTAGTLDSGYGKGVVVSHRDGFFTLYAHLSSTSVAVGDVVAAGQSLGTSGCSGMCTGPHLHFEIRAHGVPVDPFSFLP